MDHTRLRELTQDSFRTVTLPTLTLVELLDTLEECSAIADNIKQLTDEKLDLMQQIRKLHIKHSESHTHPPTNWYCCGGVQLGVTDPDDCNECRTPYPCRTIRILDLKD